MTIEYPISYYKIDELEEKQSQIFHSSLFN
jgi:hypothetical protein